jgi:hypothetical protein
LRRRQQRRLLADLLDLLEGIRNDCGQDARALDVRRAPVWVFCAGLLMGRRRRWWRACRSRPGRCLRPHECRAGQGYASDQPKFAPKNESILLHGRYRGQRGEGATNQANARAAFTSL